MMVGTVRQIQTYDWWFVFVDDSWLDISPEELDALMVKRSGISNGNSASPDLGDMANGVKSFVDKISGVDGVEFPG
jgi:hypothetical protein